MNNLQIHLNSNDSNNQWEDTILRVAPQDVSQTQLRSGHPIGASAPARMVIRATSNLDRYRLPFYRGIRWQVLMDGGKRAMRLEREARIIPRSWPVEVLEVSLAALRLLHCPLSKVCSL